MKQSSSRYIYAYGTSVLRFLREKKRIIGYYASKNILKKSPHILRELPSSSRIRYISEDILASHVDSKRHGGLIAMVECSWQEDTFEHTIRRLGKIKQQKADRYYNKEQGHDTHKKHSSPHQNRGFFVLLDGVTDAHNAGAIVRSAYAFGCLGIICGRQNNFPINSTLIKTSAGTCVDMPMFRVRNLADTLLMLNQNDWITVALTEKTHKTHDISSLTQYDNPYVFVLGSEGKGVRPRVLQSCLQQAHIATEASFSTLNVSVAAGIVFSQAFACRQ